MTSTGLPRRDPADLGRRAVRREWCLNEYAKPERTRLGGTESRVLRGGSTFALHHVGSRTSTVCGRFL